MSGRLTRLPRGEVLRLIQLPDEVLWYKPPVNIRRETHCSRHGVFGIVFRCRFTSFTRLGVP